MRLSGHWCVPMTAHGSSASSVSLRAKLAARKRSRAYYEKNKEQAKAANRARHAKNRDARNAAKRAHYARNKAAICAATAEWRRRNKRKYNAAKTRWNRKNLEKVRQCKREWNKRNPESLRVNKHNRRAREYGRGERLSVGLRARLLEEQNHRCAVCPADLRKTKSHMDHIVALARGGRNNDANIQLLCPSCNFSKQAKDQKEFVCYREKKP